MASASSPVLFDTAIKPIKRVTRFFSPPSCDVTSRYLSDAFQLSVLLHPSVSRYLHGYHSSRYGLFLRKLRPREVMRTAEAVREAGEPGRSPGWLFSAHLLPCVALLCTATSHRAFWSRGQRSAWRLGLAQGALCLPRAVPLTRVCGHCPLGSVSLLGGVVLPGVPTPGTEGKRKRLPG